MISLLTVSKAQDRIREQVKAKRLSQGFTQKGLAKRAGVSLATFRKFEQKGLISLESFLKILMVLDCLEEIIKALQDNHENFHSIKDVLRDNPQPPRKYGWYT